MKFLTAHFLNSLKAEAASDCLLLEIKYRSTGQVWRVTDYDIEIINGGVVYATFAFAVEDFSLDSGTEIDRISLSLDNTNQEQTGIYLNNDERNSTLRLVFAALDEKTAVIDTLCLFSGYLENFEIEGTQITLTCVSPLFKTMKRTLNHFSASCINKFRDGVCAYSGTDNFCNHTYTGCAAKGNTANFRGGITASKVSGTMAAGEIK